jgi:hypothetical protein
MKKKGDEGEGTGERKQERRRFNGGYQKKATSIKKAHPYCHGSHAVLNIFISSMIVRHFY